MTPKAFDVLAALAVRPGRLVTKDELLKEVWPDSFVEESNLAYHVFALRRALGESAEGQKYVETVPKRGYRFVALVSVPGDANGVGVVASPASAADVSGAGAQEEHLGPRAADTARDRPTAWRPAWRVRSRTAALWFATGACGAAVLLVFLYPQRVPEAGALTKVEVPFPGVRLTQTSTFTISPDGRRLVFAGSGPDGVTRLWVRSLDASDARPLPGTDTVLGMVPPMFWSPDSRFVAFDAAAGQLKKIDVTGGPPQTVCTLPHLVVGGSWSQDDVIVVGSLQGGISRCSASGGPASTVTNVDPSQQHSAHLLPWFLPDGRRFLYLAVSRAAPERSGLFVHALDAPPGSALSTRILDARFGAAYVPDSDGPRGHLLFMRDGGLFAQRFDPVNLQLTGEPVRVAGPVGHFLDGAFFSASRSGTLAFRPPEEARRLTWLNRQGHLLSRVGEPGLYGGLALSPDGKQAVVTKHVVGANADQDLWLVDLSSGRSSRLTSNARLEDEPLWSEDGKRVVFTGSGAIGSLFEQSLSGEQDARQLLESAQHKVPESVAPDGRFLLYTSAAVGATRIDVHVPDMTFDAFGGSPDWSVSPDGSRFLVLLPEARATPTSFSSIFNWQAALDGQR